MGAEIRPHKAGHIEGVSKPLSAEMMSLYSYPQLNFELLRAGLPSCHSPVLWYEETHKSLRSLQLVFMEGSSHINTSSYIV